MAIRLCIIGVLAVFLPLGAGAANANVVPGGYPTARPSGSLAAPAPVTTSPSIWASVPKPHERPKFGGTIMSFADAALYRSAFADARHFRWDSARAKAAQARHRLLATVIEWQYYRARTNNEPFEVTAAFAEKHTNWPGMDLLYLRAEKQITGDESDAVLDRWFAAHPPASVHGQEQLALLLRRQGKGALAVEVLRRAWIEGHFTDKDEKEFARTHNRILRTADHEERLDRLLWNGQSEAAARQLERVIGDTKKLARARLALLRKEAGVDYHIGRVPGRLENDPGLLYERVKFRRKKDMTDDAADLLINLSGAGNNGLGRADLVWVERRIIARRLMKDRDYRTAYKIVARHGLEPGAEFADAEFLAGWLALKYLNKPKKAARHFRALYDNVSRPVSLARATYWLAETASAVGRKETATRWYMRAAKYSTTFYGQLAQDKLAETTGLHTPHHPASDAEVPPVAGFERRELVRVVRALDAIGENNLVDRFMYSMRQQANSLNEFQSLADLANSINRPDQMVRVAREASWRHINLPEARFPVESTPAYGRTDDALTRVPEEALLYALMRQESGFKADAQSHVGARGLMQLMPGTARYVAKNIGVSYRVNDLTEDPAYNMLLGSSYLAELLERFEGSYILAIAGYNAGPHRVEKWLEDYGDPRTGNISAVDWVEHIPFDETRNYVQRVTEAILPYRSRLGHRNHDRKLTSIINRHAPGARTVADAH